MNRLVIFDLDGTLVDSVADLAQAVNTTLESMGYPTHPVDAYYHFVGNGIPKLCERALPEDATDEDLEFLLKGFNQYYSRHCLDFTKPYEGMMEAVKAIKAAGIGVAVASNKAQDFAAYIVESLFGKGTFDCIKGASANRPRKPAPDILVEIMEDMDTDVQHTIMVGDSDVDIQTATNANLPSIGCVWGFRGAEELSQAGADCLAMTPDELPSICETLA